MVLSASLRTAILSCPAVQADLAAAKHTILQEEAANALGTGRQDVLAARVVPRERDSHPGFTYSRMVCASRGNDLCRADGDAELWTAV